MVKTPLKKSLVCGIIVLFLVMNVTSIASRPSMEKYVFSNFQLGNHDFRDDTTPPVTTLSFNPEAPDGNNDWYISNVTITLNATDDLSGVNVTWYKVNEGEWEIYEYPFMLNTSNYYVIDYYSIDNAGNVENVKSASCEVDVVPPVTTFHIDDGNYHILYLEATDDMSGVYKTYINVDGGAWQAYTGPIIFTTDGSHNIRFYSIDRAGNVEDIQQITIHPHTDTIPPVVTLTVEKIFFNKWKFIAEACDADSGMDRVEFYVDNQLLGNVTAPGPYYEWIWITTDNKGHSVQAIAYDLAGNSKASDVITSFPQSYSHDQPTFQYINHFIQNLIQRQHTTKFI